MVYATAAITILSFSVWVHHFFTMGASPNVNLFFGIATMMIAIPTGVKTFNWLFTMYRGRIRFTTPMYWTLGFIVTFAIGGSAGVMLAIPPADYVLHNSLFLIAHFHNVLIPGSLFGYKSMVYATAAITVLSFSVWVHHFFTMGASPNVNLFFGIATMMIGIPTGVKTFNWLFTMYRGRIRFTTPMYWTLGFIVTFAIGGSAGVMLAMPPADYVLHNSLFLIAHFHNVLIPGSLFGFLAGYYYWFPKAMGFRLQ